MNEQSKSTVVLHRTPNSIGMMRDLQIFIDSQKVGALPYNSKKEFHLEPGIHEVSVSMDWCKSNPLEIYVGAGESLDLYCGARFFGKRWILNIFATFLFPRKLFVVCREPNTEMLTPYEDRQQRAKILALTFTSALMIPILALIRIIFTRVTVFSKNFGPSFDFIIPLCGAISFVLIIFLTIYIWRWLKNMFEHK